MGCGFCRHLTQSHLSQELRSEGGATQPAPPALSKWPTGWGPSPGALGGQDPTCPSCAATCHPPGLWGPVPGHGVMVRLMESMSSYRSGQGTWAVQKEPCPPPSPPPPPLPLPPPPSPTHPPTLGRAGCAEGSPRAGLGFPIAPTTGEWASW